MRRDCRPRPTSLSARLTQVGITGVSPEEAGATLHLRSEPSKGLKNLVAACAHLISQVPGVTSASVVGHRGKYRETLFLAAASGGRVPKENRPLPDPVDNFPRDEVLGALSPYPGSLSNRRGTWERNRQSKPTAGIG